VETAIYAALTGDPTLAATFGARVFPVQKPQRAALPAITYQRVSGQMVASIAGGSKLQNARFSIDLWGKSYSDIHGATLQAVVDAMQSSADFRSVCVLPPIDDYEVDTEQYRVTMDFSVWER